MDCAEALKSVMLFLAIIAISSAILLAVKEIDRIGEQVPVATEQGE